MMTCYSRIFTCNLAQRSICWNVWTAGNPDRTWASTKRPKKPEAKLQAETLRSSKLGTGSHPFSNNTHLISWWIFMDFPSWHVDFSKLSTARFTTKSLREKQQSSTKGHVFCSSHRCIRFEHWQLTCRQCDVCRFNVVGDSHDFVEGILFDLTSSPNQFEKGDLWSEPSEVSDAPK